MHLSLAPADGKAHQCSQEYYTALTALDLIACASTADSIVFRSVLTARRLSRATFAQTRVEANGKNTAYRCACLLALNQVQSLSHHALMVRTHHADARVCLH